MGGPTAQGDSGLSPIRKTGVTKVTNITFMINNEQKGPAESDQNVNNKSDEQEGVVFVSR